MSELTKTIHVRLDNETYRWLEDVCTGKSKSVFIRDMLQEVQNGGKPAIKKSKKSSSVSPQGTILSLTYAELADKVEAVVAERSVTRLKKQLSRLTKKNDMESIVLRNVLHALIEAMQ